MGHTILYNVYCTVYKETDMPQVTVYIRNDDLDKWREIPNKAEFIRIGLNSLAPSRIAIKKEAIILNPPEKNGGVANISTEKIKEIQAAKGLDFCKHGAVKGLCKKGCK
jgi:hypothetical protein